MAGIQSFVANTIRYIFLIAALFALSISCQNKKENQAWNYLSGFKPDNTYIWMEAEDASGMADKSFIIVDDSSSFGGKYIEKPSGVLKLNFEVPANDHFKILGRVFSKDGNADSWAFMLTRENGDTIVRDIWNNINWGRWHEWVWEEMTTGRTTNDLWRPYLEKGNYTLSFISRDANDCMLDKLLITNDTAFVPGESEESEAMVYKYLEAEAGEMEAPFKIGQDDSGVVYAWVEKANAVYEFQINQPGQYRIWGYVRGEDGHSDSVIGWLNDEPMSVWHFALDRKWQVWKWVPYISGDNNAHDFEVGLHKFTINQREAGSKLDALLVTNDLDYIPQNKNSR